LNVLNFVRLSGAKIKRSSIEQMSFPYKRVIANMATSRKMEHLREWKEIVCWDTASEEPRPELEFLEMFHDPDRRQPVMNKGRILDDSSLSCWFSKAVRLN
jgi:hypothetical protein